MSRRRTLAAAVCAIVVATGAATLVLPGHRGLVVSTALMAAFAVVLVDMVRAADALAPRTGSAWADVLRTPMVERARPDDLEQLERVLGWGRYSSGDFNYEVRPVLRRIVAQRLMEVRGVDIDARPDAAREAVSPELWDAVVAKRSSEEARVIRTADIERIVSEIEAIR